MFYYGFYKQREARWIKSNPFTGYHYYQDSYKGKIYRRTLPSLDKHELARTGFRQFIEGTGLADPRLYISGLKKYPYLEQLSKAGLPKLVGEILLSYDGIEMKKSKELGKALMIDKQRLQRLRNQNGGIQFLKWLRLEKKQGKLISDGVIAWFVEEKIKAKNLEFISDRMSAQQVKNYLERQKIASGESAKNLLSTWKDYLTMAARLKMDVSDEIVYRVKDLPKRHDELVSLIEEYEDELRADEIAAKYPNVNRIYQEIKEKYAYEDKTYAILIPNGIPDILAEGMALHHCIDKSDRYFERINKRESYILFLRKKEAIDQPYYTLEIEPDGAIRQKRTEYDRQKEDIKKAEPFLLKWQKEVSKRATSADYALAKESKILREEEFAEMRRDNIKIYGGAYAGRLLADVLQEDLMENVQNVGKHPDGREMDVIAA